MLKTMWVTRFRVATIVWLVVAALGAGTVWLTYLTQTAEQIDPPRQGQQTYSSPSEGEPGLKVTSPTDPVGAFNKFFHFVREKLHANLQKRVKRP
jgi:hypothetical protein